MNDSSGIAIDLSGLDTPPLMTSTEVFYLNSLYKEWDVNPHQPLLANEVAQQIWFILNNAIEQHYPNVTDVVIVGGDDVIPFYRAPDETLISNESDYYNQLRGTRLMSQGRPLPGSLFFNTVQTDNFYVDRKPTPYRGRGLYIPDMGIGRLVESPAEIMSYLNGYLISRNYTIDASTADSAVLVTGYDFLTDQANAVAARMERYGFSSTGTPGSTNTFTLTTLISDTWDAQDLSDVWFSKQLPLASTYDGPSIRYALMSVNGHFTHFETIPAKLEGGGTLSATLLLDPNALKPENAFFKQNGAPTLVYSVGCHSGLNAARATFDGTTPDGRTLQSDFAKAILKQGGNLIGNTGYGYGDSDVVAYSERLSVLFTVAIGRRIVENNEYVGASIGESLARAKRLYLQNSRPGGFSVYDEKVVMEMTLYGLPFIRVKVPIPTRPGPGGSFDPLPLPMPSDLHSNSGTFTRIITLTNTFDPLPEGANLISRVTGVVKDSFAPTRIVTLNGVNQVLAGQPVLPNMVYDITLQENPSAPGIGIPQPRGVRLLSATALTDTQAFNPHVTTITTDSTYLIQETDPLLDPVKGQWLPEQPYTYVRSSISGLNGAVVTTDKLLITPAMFRTATSTEGTLRRFSQMVFEVTYADPGVASAALMADSTPPLIGKIMVAQIPATQGLAATGPQVAIIANVSDSGGMPGSISVKLSYSTDGLKWQSQTMQAGLNGQYTAIFSPTQYGTGGSFSYVVEARDPAGNVATNSGKGIAYGDQATTKYLYLPLIFK